MKPFIKPRPPAGTPVPIPPPTPRVSPNELTVLAVASAIADPAERSAYLDRVCGGDAEFRARLEQRLAERAAASLPAVVQRSELMPAPRPGQGGGMALVSMPDMQLSPAGPPPVRHSPVPWVLATLLAAAVGALAVIFSSEKAARSIAESKVQNAQTAVVAAERAKTTAENERDAALAKEMESRTAATRSTEKLKEEERLRKAAEAEAEKARGTATSASDIAEKASAQAKSAQAAEAALKSAAREKTVAFRVEQAATLEKYAAELIDHGKHGEAVAPARSAVELREQPAESAGAPAGAAAAPVVVAPDARYLLGAALMGKGDVAGAEKEFLTVVGAIEPVLAQAPAGDPVRAKYAVVVKKLAQLYSTTGRKREASDWRHKLDGQR